MTFKWLINRRGSPAPGLGEPAVGIPGSRDAFWVPCIASQALLLVLLMAVRVPWHW